MKHVAVILILIFSFFNLWAQTPIWAKYEIELKSEKTYDNPIYEVHDFRVVFTSPSGIKKTVRGFWDGGTTWKIRFMPDEIGTWKWQTACSDKENKGLHEKEGKFRCVKNTSEEMIFQKGEIRHEAGKYYLSYQDGTPFFWLACTAWNGALKSSKEEWTHYLNQRKENHYNTIQLVTTEWRGCDKTPEGYTAIEGVGHIRIHPEFFKRIDERIDQANKEGFVVSPIVLWALPRGKGRELSPGYTLPLEEAVLLAKYIVARYQGNHVVWSLGGDGNYTGVQELKWKEIGRRVFNDIDHSVVTLHPGGRSFIGDLYAEEDWYSLMSYQTTHNKSALSVDWLNKGQVGKMWSKLKPMPYINMEPNYEEYKFIITARDVRNVAYWSIFRTPVAGISYGANGVWPWLRPGERILNHNDKGGVTGWRKSIEFPGSIQMGYLFEFIQQFNWWQLYPANQILQKQPGDEIFNHWVSVVKTYNDELIIAYVPEKAELTLVNPKGFEYTAQWFNPASNEYSNASICQKANLIEFKHDFKEDRVIILKKK